MTKGALIINSICKYQIFLFFCSDQGHCGSVYNTHSHTNSGRVICWMDTAIHLFGKSTV